MNYTSLKDLHLSTQIADQKEIESSLDNLNKRLDSFDFSTLHSDKASFMMNALQHIAYQFGGELPALTSISENSCLAIADATNLDISQTDLISGDLNIDKLSNFYPFCPNAGAIKFSDSISSLYPSTFDTMSRLTSIEMPKDTLISTILANTDVSCSQLKRLSLGKNVNYIGENAFRDCSNLERLDIPASTIDIKDGAFQKIDFKKCKIIVYYKDGDPKTQAEVDDFKAKSVQISQRLARYSPDVEIGKYEDICVKYGVTPVPDDFSPEPVSFASSSSSLFKADDHSHGWSLTGTKSKGNTKTVKNVLSMQGSSSFGHMVWTVTVQITVWSEVEDTYTCTTGTPYPCGDTFTASRWIVVSQRTEVEVGDTQQDALNNINRKFR